MESMRVTDTLDMLMLEGVVSSEAQYIVTRAIKHTGVDCKLL